MPLISSQSRLDPALFKDKVAITRKRYPRIENWRQREGSDKNCFFSKEEWSLTQIDGQRKGQETVGGGVALMMAPGSNRSSERNHAPVEHCTEKRASPFGLMEVVKRPERHLPNVRLLPVSDTACQLSGAVGRVRDAYLNVRESGVSFYADRNSSGTAKLEPARKRKSKKRLLDVRGNKR